MNRLFWLLLQPFGLLISIYRLFVPPDRTAEELATPSEDYPLAGFWKDNKGDQWGLAIAPAGEGYYSISFCGPGGCFKPGTYRNNSKIIGDDDGYRVINNDTIEVNGKNGYTRYYRVKSRVSN